LFGLLRRYDIHYIVVFDSGCPKEKEPEKAERFAQKTRQRGRIVELQQQIDQYMSAGASEVLGGCTSEQSIRVKNASEQPSRVKENSALTKQRLPVVARNLAPITNIREARNKLREMRTRDIRVSQADFEVLQSLLDLLHIPYTYAPLEAETACSDLCIRSCVDAVLSEDTDVFAYGTPMVISRIDVGSFTVTYIEYSRVLLELELNSDAFLDFCILCGTDYNQPIHGMTVLQAYSAIRQHGSIENIEPPLSPVVLESLNFLRIREIFRQYTHSAINYVPYVGIANLDAVVNFLTQQNGSADDYYSDSQHPTTRTFGRLALAENYHHSTQNRRRHVIQRKTIVSSDWRAERSETDFAKSKAESVNRWFRPQNNIFAPNTLRKNC
jgi:5'-3' exonuclease